MARGDKQVFVSVQVHVQKNRCPRPLGSLHAAEECDFGVSSVAAIHKKRVVRVLRTVIDLADTGRIKGKIANLQMALRVVATEHVQDKEFVESIAVEVGEINPHRKHAGLSQRQFGNRAKPAFAVVDPDAVFGGKIVADINVRRAVAIEVAKHHRQSPVVRRFRQSLSFFIEKRSVGK